MRSLGVRFNEEKVEELLPLVKLGQQDAIHQMIRHYIGLAVSKARSFGMDDELVDVAIFTITEAVHDIALGVISKHDNIGAYLTLRLNRALTIEYNTQTIWVPRNGKKVPINQIPEQVEDKNWQTVFSIVEQTLGKEVRDVFDIVSKWIENQSQELVWSSGDVDSYVIVLRTFGFNDLEISKILGISKSEIGRIRSTIRKAYDDERLERKVPTRTRQSSRERRMSKNAKWKAYSNSR